MKILILAFSLSWTAFGCLHFDAKYRYSIREGTKVAFLFHDEKSAHLIVRTELHSNGGDLPKEVAWVMPFPAMPTHYEEVDNTVFDELGNLVSLTKRAWSDPSASPGKPGGASALKVHAKVFVGNYTIQPIEILSPTDGKEFNAWLKQNHFNPMPLRNQKPYLKKGAVFLAIRMELLGREADLKPLHIVYPATELSFPLRFTHDTRKFDLDLFVASVNPPSAERVGPFFLEPMGSASWGSEEVKRRFPALAKLLGDKTVTLTKWRGTGFNSEKKRLSTLTADPTF